MKDRKYSSSLQVIIILLLALSLNLNFEKTLQANSSQTVLRPDWSLSVRTSLEQLTQNATKMTVTFNTTFFDNIIVSPWSSGINFKINSDYATLFDDQCCSLTYQNYTLKQGSTITPYIFIFFLPGTNIASYTQNNNTFSIGVNQYLTQKNSNQYLINLSINPNFPSYTGELTINLNPNLQLKIGSSFWNTFGYLGHPYSNNLKNNSNVNSNILNILFLLSTITFLGVLAIVLTNEHKKFTNEKKNSKSQTNFLKYLKERLTKRKKSIYDHQTLSEETFDLMNEIIEENKENSN